MNERLNNYEMSAIGMKKRKREKREIFSFLLLCVLLSKEKKKERERRFESASIFLYQCGNRNEGVSSIILTT
jgi:hypothetical protein